MTDKDPVREAVDRILTLDVTRPDWSLRVERIIRHHFAEAREDSRLLDALLELGITIPTPRERRRGEGMTTRAKIREALGEEPDDE